MSKQKTSLYLTDLSLRVNMYFFQNCLKKSEVFILSIPRASAVERYKTWFDNTGMVKIFRQKDVNFIGLYSVRVSPSPYLAYGSSFFNEGKKIRKMILVLHLHYYYNSSVFCVYCYGIELVNEKFQVLNFFKLFTNYK